MRKLLLLLFLLMNIIIVKAQKVIPLYPGTIPNSKETVDREYTDTPSHDITIVHKISRPTLTIFEAPKEKSNGTAVVICPGGGYSIVAIGHEGYDVAKRFNEMGVTAFVLKYRIPDDSTMINRTIGPLQDAERAMQYVRGHAKEYHLNKKRIGIMGFSAGGHLASTEGTHYNNIVIDNKSKTNLRPDFMLLIYPVISFTDSLMHQGSRDNLLGKNISAERVSEYSNEMRVNKNTPPTFLVHAKDDQTVKYQNSEVFYQALKKSGVPADIYYFEKGGHGFGMSNPTSQVKWMDLVQEWMKKNGFLPK